MGNTASTTVQSCLETAVGAEAVAFSSTLFYKQVHVKLYNLDVPVAPAAVVYPSTPQEVAAIVKCAADNGLKVQPRGGGHSYANYGIGGQDGGIAVDMKNFKQFAMDTTSWQVTLGAGHRLGDITTKLHEYRRAMPYGVVQHIGLGGHATIGGLGPSSRMWGTALDQIQEVEVVLANSSIIRASDTQNQDVFFAIKGAAAGFGIVTEFKMTTHPEPEPMVSYSFDVRPGGAASQADAFKQWQKFISDPGLTRKFASQFILAQDLGAMITGTFFGTQEEYDSLDLPAHLPALENHTIQIKDWLGTVTQWGEDVLFKIVGGIPKNFYAKSFAYTEKDLVPDNVIDTLFQYIEDVEKGPVGWFVAWDLEGGATNDIAPDATAYGHRDAIYFHQSYAVTLEGRVSETTKNFLTGINNIVANAEPGHNLGTYAGYVDPALGNGTASAESYWTTNVNRLQQIKAAIDPQDVFHNPQSIRPAGR